MQAVVFIIRALMKHKQNASASSFNLLFRLESYSHDITEGNIREKGMFSVCTQYIYNTYCCDTSVPLILPSCPSFSCINRGLFCFGPLTEWSCPHLFVSIHMHTGRSLSLWVSVIKVTWTELNRQFSPSCGITKVLCSWNCSPDCDEWKSNVVS